MKIIQAFRMLVLILFLSTSLGISRAATKPDYVKSQGFFISDGTLYDYNGNPFIIRGVNNPHIWYDTYDRYYAYDALDNIREFGFNAIRVVWETTGEASLLREIISRIIELQMVPMIELHDVTGNTSNESLLEMARYFTRDDIKSIMLDYEEYLLINIANEWSGDDFDTAYKAVITHLRDNGLHHTIVIDANGWGQNIDALLTYGPDLIEYDPEHNILLSVHMYQLYSDPNVIINKLQEAKELNLPLIVGEFGFQHGTPPEEIDVPTILAECEKHGFGYMPWSWKGNSGGVEYLDMSNDWEGTELTDWGNQVIYDVNGIRNTSVMASIFEGTLNRRPVVTITSPSDDEQYTIGENITVNVTASDEDGTIQYIELYLNSEIIGSTEATTSTFDLGALAVGTYTINAITEDNNGTTASSAYITIKVIDPNAPDNLTAEWNIINHWESGGNTFYQVEVVVTNEGTKTARWEIDWTFPGSQQVTSYWNALLTQTGTHVHVEPSSAWNATIPSGQSINFGLIIQGDICDLSNTIDILVVD